MFKLNYSNLQLSFRVFFANLKKASDIFHGLRFPTIKGSSQSSLVILCEFKRIN